MRYSGVIWDFNGTLLDDVQIGIDSINAVLIRRGLPTIGCAQDYRRIFGFPVEDYYRRLGIDIDSEGFDKSAHEWVAEYKSRECYARIREGAVEIIRAFADLGVPQTIISATERGMLLRQLSDLGISEYFDEIYGCDNIYARSKTALAVSWAQTHSLHAIMIGDTSHDYETACAAGIDCALITGGHEDEERLKRCPCPVFSSYSELFEWIMKEEG